MGKEAAVGKLLKKKRSAVPSNEASSIYLILPSYAEKHKAEIKMIIAQEKINYAAINSTITFSIMWNSMLPFPTVETSRN